MYPSPTWHRFGFLTELEIEAVSGLPACPLSHMQGSWLRPTLLGLPEYVLLGFFYLVSSSPTAAHQACAGVIVLTLSPSLLLNASCWVRSLAQNRWFACQA